MKNKIPKTADKNTLNMPNTQFHKTGGTENEFTERPIPESVTATQCRDPQATETIFLP